MKRINWIIQPPTFIRDLFPNSIWRFEANDEKFVCLTFDDGPVPEQTSWVMDLLEREGIHATFFCVGDNIGKHPKLFEELKRRGHDVGNHSYNHVQLFKMSWEEYLDNVNKSNEIMQGATLYRAPHGQMLPWRAKQLTRKEFSHIVFWDVMPEDYDKRNTPEQVLQNVKDFVRPGSVIVFHDSIKAGERMRYALEGTIKFLKENGYSFKTVKEAIASKQNK